MLAAINDKQPDNQLPEKIPAPGNGRAYIVEGEIAAGKTELIKALAAGLASRGLAVAVVLEPVDQWRAVGISQRFYDDPANYGYRFQTFVFATRVLAISRAVAAAPSADVYLLERSPATDLVFMYAQAGLVDPMEMEMYSAWCDAYRLMLPIDLTKATVLYLKTDLGKCMDRLGERARAEEICGSRPQGGPNANGGVSAEYQQRLRSLHEAYLLGLGAEEFPGLPKCPFPLHSVKVIEPSIANLDWRAGPGGEEALQAIIALMGLP